MKETKKIVKTGWVNIFKGDKDTKNRTIYPSKKEALKNALHKAGYFIKTTEIMWEE